MATPAFHRPLVHDRELYRPKEPEVHDRELARQKEPKFYDRAHVRAMRAPVTSTTITIIVSLPKALRSTRC